MVCESIMRTPNLTRAYFLWDYGVALRSRLFGVQADVLGNRPEVDFRSEFFYDEEDPEQAPGGKPAASLETLRVWVSDLSDGKSDQRYPFPDRKGNSSAY